MHTALIYNYMNGFNVIKLHILYNFEHESSDIAIC